MANSAGFIGLGLMGTRMAANLMKHQVKLYIHNRTKEKAQGLINAGAEFIDSPNDLFKKTSIVFSIKLLSNPRK